MRTYQFQGQDLPRISANPALPGKDQLSTHGLRQTLFDKAVVGRTATTRRMTGSKAYLECWLAYVEVIIKESYHQLEHFLALVGAPEYCLRKDPSGLTEILTQPRQRRRVYPRLPRR